MDATGRAQIQNALRQIPAVDGILRHEAVAPWIAEYGQQVVTDAVRQAQHNLRADILSGHLYAWEDLLGRICSVLDQIISPTLVPAINATGVILHTNLGRSPLSEAALTAMKQVGQGYSNLEFDLTKGHRGSRYTHAEALLCRLTGAEAALVVNNNAGAVLLTLMALTQGREVIISRGELVEIGGGFRIPDVMAQSGAHLVEVGTTNRTYARDYASALNEQTAALMRVHSSNFRVSGFTETPTLAELVDLAHSQELLLLDDLGSGTLLDTEQYGLPHEPTIQESVHAGADIVSFSGDKLLGGPQAGFIVGRSTLIQRLKRHPLTRALRVDKTTLAGIQANLLHYVKGEATEQVPIWRMVSVTADEIGARAQAILSTLGAKGAGCTLKPGRSMIGGGSLPEESVPTTRIVLPEIKADSLARRLRLGKPPIVGRIEDDRVVLDLRTVLARQEATLAQRLGELL